MEVKSMKILFSLLIVFSVAASALAQESSKVEVFGGYSYLRADSNLGVDRDLRGWNASINYNLNKILGVKADFSGHYTDGAVFLSPVTDASAKIDTSDFTFLFGPQFSYRKNEKVVPFAHIMIGGVRRKISSPPIDVGFPDFPIIIDPSSTNTAFAAAFGGGLDIKLTNGLAFRLVQADYLLSRFGGFTQNNLRIGTGLVVRF
jgi:opacity protein-like surface antigen